MMGSSSDSERHEQHYERFFETLANPLRMRILCMLLKKPYSVSQLVAETGEEQSKVSHALGILLICRLVRVEKKGRLRIYEAESKRVRPLLKLVDETLCTACAGRCRQELRKERASAK